MARAQQLGFTYIGLLVAVVVLGVALSAVGMVWHTQAQREREQELLFIGHQFKTAIAAYYNSGVGGRQYPQQLSDLLEDMRMPVPHHYLRRLYNDPMTGAADWTLVRVEGLGITGVASSSQAAPLKHSGFSTEETTFEDATCYCQWQFVYVPRNFRRRAGPVTSPSPIASPTP
jgi:type II secretory pathway pseudopilin PulG